jgi:sigma-54-specific transcriptional regulator
VSPSPAKILAHPDPRAISLSVRAKAVIFSDPKSQQLLEQIERVAATDATVLVIGESGTGKELVAKHIHEQSGRKGPFVAINCGALSQTLAEAELFGHQAGAFTGATETRAGWFEAANGGTLFLDEIGDLPQSLQVKLLRVLQEREVVRVGSRKPIALDVRLIAATNVDLGRAVSAGHFRLDLYYRLNVVRFELPPLRERRGDILPLAEYFIDLYSARLQLDRPVLAPAARTALLNYPWSGNIRELENVVHIALLFASGGAITVDNLRFTVAPVPPGAEDNASPLERIGAQLDRLFAANTPDLHAQLEELIFRRAFNFTGGNQLQTARLLGISRNVLRTGLKRYGLIGGGDDAAAD